MLRRWPAAVVLAATVLVAALIAYPLLRMIWEVFSNATPVTAPFERMLHIRGIGQVAWWTVEYVAGSTLLALFLGVCLSWINVRTDGGFRLAAGVIPLLPLIIPPIGSALGYLILLSPATGLGNLLLRQIFIVAGTDGPINITSMGGMIVVTAVSLAPIVYLIVSAALRNINPALDEAARIFGYGPWHTAWRVTLPMLRPTIGSAALLVGVQAVSSFSLPFILGTSAGVTPISVYIYRLFSSFPARTDLAVAIGLVLLVIVYFVTWLRSFLLERASQRHGYDTSAAGDFTAFRLGRWRWLTRGFVAVYLLLTVLPLVGLLAGSLQPYLGAGPHEWGLHNYQAVLASPESRNALFNSYRLGFGAACIDIVVVASLLYFCTLFLSNTRWLEYVLMAPSVVPHIVIGVAFALTYSMSPFRLQGTQTLILLAYCMLFIPEATQSCQAALSQLSRESSEAARIFGAGVFLTLRRVVLPQARGGLAAGWLVVFFLAVNEVTVSAFLGGFHNSVIGFVAIDYFTNGRLGEVAAIALLSMCITAGIAAIGSRLAWLFKDRRYAS